VAAAWLETTAQGVVVRVVVQPRASRSRIVGEHDGRLKIQLAAPPVDGEANAALVELVAERVGIKKSAVTLLDGQTGRRKRLNIEGADAAVVEAALAPGR
jgi:uncharacterized protein